MYLIIDPSESEALVVHHSLDGKVWHEYKATLENVSAMLPAIERAVQAAGKTLHDIRGVAVVVGKGRFTATRAAVTIVNTLAYSLAIPVVGITEVTEKNVVDALVHTPVGQYVHASYSAPPRVGGGIAQS